MRLLVVALVLLGPSSALAVQLGQPRTGMDLPGATLQVQDTFYFKWNSFLDENPDDDLEPPFGYAELLNRVSADLRIRRFTLGVQLDFVANAPGCGNASFESRYRERYGQDAACRPTNNLRGDGWPEGAPEYHLFRPEKFYAQYRSPNLNVDLGDFYASIGRGIVLSFVKKPEIDLDTSLFGGRVDVVLPRFDLTVLAGVTNPQEVSVELRNQAIRKVDPSLLAGGVLRVRPVDRFELTGHAVGYDLSKRPSLGAGGTLALSGLGDAVDLFVEADGFRWGAAGDEEAASPRDGYAIYGALTAYKGPLTFLLEAKRYKNSQLLTQPGPVAPVKFVEPPSLEFETAVTSDVNEGIQSNDITGVRAQADLFFFQSGTRITGSMLVAADDQNHPPTSPQRELSLSPWVMVDQPISLPKAELHLRGYLGYRHDLPRRDPVDGLPAAEADRLAAEYLRQSGLLFAHADVGITFGAHAIEWVTYYRRSHFTLEEEACWMANGEEQCDSDDGWVSIENALSYTLLGKYTGALHLDWTDDNVVQNAANGGSIGNARFDPERRSSLYVGGEFILKPSPNLEIAAFVGSQKAGLVCTGGACRTVPAFHGVKSRVTVSF